MSEVWERLDILGTYQPKQIRMGADAFLHQATRRALGLLALLLSHAATLLYKALTLAPIAAGFLSSIRGLAKSTD
jgi:hypothetical protein